MILTLIHSALAGSYPDPRDPHVQATVDVMDDGVIRRTGAGFHVGFDMTGPNPGLAARFDFGHRVSVEGVVFGAAPTADRLQWTGGGSIGVDLAPMRLQLGTQGTLDLRMGVGARATGGGGGSLTGGGLDLGGWGSGVLQYSPDGSWSFYGGLMALETTPRGVPTGPGTGPVPIEIVPNAGVRFRIE